MYQVIWTYDGCPDKAASIEMEKVQQCKDFIVATMNRHPTKFANDPKLGLDILDLQTGRFISYVLC
jgi:hypothetical protein